MSRQGGWDIPAEGSLQPGADRPSTTIRFGAPAAPIAPASAPVADEETTAYGLGPRLGRTGEVYEARSARFRNREAVAMKMYPRATAVTVGTAEVFAGDAARASGLRHPHIVHVIEAGTLRDGTPFATMEYLTGRTLEDQLNGRGAFLATELLPLIRGVGSALSAAHAAGLVHGQVRPDNIFIMELTGYESGFVKVLDFGARHLTAAYARTGQPLSARETLYFAPEQLPGHRGDDLDARADQFALAAITYRMLSGVNAPSGDGLGEGSAPVRPSGTEATAVMPLARRAPAVDAVVSKALSRLPEHRFESISLFLRALEEALAGAALIATPGPTRADSSREAREPPGGNARPVARRDGNPTPMPSSLPLQTPAPMRAPAGRPLGVDQPRAIPRRYPAIERPSLTQQFFQEGDEQEAARYDNAPFSDGASPDSGLAFDSFDRIPKRRAPLFLAVLATLIAAGGLAWWAGVRPPRSWRQSPWWTALHLPSGENWEPTTPPEAPGPLPSGVTEQAPTSAGTSAPAGSPTPPPPGTPETAPTAPTSALPNLTPPQPTAAPALESPPQPATAPTAPAEVTNESTPSESSPSPATAKRQSGSASSSSRRAARQRTATGNPALRGFIWSPEKQSMVPAEGRAPEPWPRGESAPPPPPLAPSDSRPGPPPFTP